MDGAQRNIFIYNSQGNHSECVHSAHTTDCIQEMDAVIKFHTRGCRAALPTNT